MRNCRKLLKETILQLELKQEEEKELFNQQLRATFNSLKPANLIKSTLRDLSNHTSEVKNNLLEAFLPMITSFISGKIIGRGKKHSFSHIIATMLQMTLTKYTAKHSQAILAYLCNILDHLKGFFTKTSEAIKEGENEHLNEPEKAQDPEAEFEPPKDQMPTEDQEKQAE